MADNNGGKIAAVVGIVAALGVGAYFLLKPKKKVIAKTPTGSTALDAQIAAQQAKILAGQNAAVNTQSSGINCNSALDSLLKFSSGFFGKKSSGGTGESGGTSEYDTTGYGYTGVGEDTASTGEYDTTGYGYTGE